VVHQGQGRRPFHVNLTHVGNIEQAGLVPDGIVFFDDTSILHRHSPTTEVDDLRTQFLVLGIQWCLLQFVFVRQAITSIRALEALRPSE